MWSNHLFPVGVSFSQVGLGQKQLGVWCLRQASRGNGFASVEWTIFAFGTETEALGQAVPWTFLHKSVSSQPLACLLPHLPPQSLRLSGQAFHSVAYKISTGRGAQAKSMVNHSCS